MFVCVCVCVTVYACIYNVYYTVQGSEDSMVYVEALDHYLEVFVSFLGDPDALPPSLLSAPLVQVFDAYLKTKLISPRGWRGLEREKMVRYLNSKKTTETLSRTSCRVSGL